MKCSRIPRLAPMLGLILTLAACRHTGTSATKADPGSVTVESPVLFDLNDVSFLVKNPKNMKSEDEYLKFTAVTPEGPLLSEDKFNSVLGLVGNSRPKDYGTWAVSAIRIDNCAKILAASPCVAQIRLVFQPLQPNGKFKSFDDQALHMAFDIEDSKKLAMFQDFLDLKKSALPASANGPLGENPILAKQSMTGPYAKRLYSTILKYTLPSQVERIAVMTSSSAGSLSTGDWQFAVTLPLRIGRVEASPIPCQEGKVNIFAVQGAIFGESFSSIKPPMKGCSDLDITPFLTKKIDATNRDAITDAAVKTSNPTLTFFGSTTCINCHLASRRLNSAAGRGTVTLDANNAFFYKKPQDVSKEVSKESQKDNTTEWGIRAFGWGEFGTVPGISEYTLNDSMRVAHELNDLIRSGDLH